jgi:hypothetical protein
MATIEVKSFIKKAGKGGPKQVCKATIAHRKLDRQTSMSGMGGGWRPKHIVSYVVGFKGPARMRTVANWLPKICTALDTEPNLLPDMIITLGKGVVWRIDAFPNLEHEDITKGKIWGSVQQTNQNLFTLFVHMLSWMGWISTPPSLDEYFKDLYLENVEFI